MPVVDFKFTVTGLKELVSAFGSDKVNKQIATGITDIANKLNTELGIGVLQRYAYNKPLDSVLRGKGAVVWQSKNHITATLTYDYKPIDLSQFPYSPHEIPNRYATHSASVLRGQSRVVHGKSGNGGFVPRKGPNHSTSPNKAWLARNGKTRMFERTGRPRLPLRVLYGPSLTQMANTVLTVKPTKGISAITDNLDTLLVNRLDL